MFNKYEPTYIVCPDCHNILDSSFTAKQCPNPLCGFNFKGLEGYINQSDKILHKELKRQSEAPKGRKYKLIITAIRFNMYTYVAHFIECSSGAHYNTIFKYFIREYLDDINILKAILSSKYIKDAKNNTTTSKNGYKIYNELYRYLMKIKNKEIKHFLKTEFPILHIKYKKLP